MIEPLAEFCPKCGAPMDTGGDDSRICAACGWFGWKTETCQMPPDTSDFNPTLSAVQVLALYRNACRMELLAEQLFDAGHGTEADLSRVRLKVRSATHAAIEMFTALRRLPARPIILGYVMGALPWPPTWEPRRYNANTEPCDVLIGPCACGADHTENEDWVQAVLKAHNCVLQQL